MYSFMLLSAFVSLRLPTVSQGKANRTHYSSYTSENIVKLQFRKLNKIICKNKKPSPAWEEEEEGKVMPHNSLFAQTINVKKEQ